MTHDGSTVLEPFISVTGGLFPIALWGRTSLKPRRQCPIFDRASSRLMNQWVFRHSARNLPLKLSMKALAIDLGPGADKGSIRRLAWSDQVENHALLIGPKVEIPGDELRALIDTDRLWVTDCLRAGMRAWL